MPDRLVPSNVYGELPRGSKVEESYSQVVSATGENHVHVAGTVSVNTDGDLVGENDIGEQARQIIKNIDESLAAAGAEKEDVVRINIFALDCEEYLAEGHEHVKDYFGPDHLPSSTLVGVDSLAHPGYLVEINATAIY